MPKPLKTIADKPATRKWLWRGPQEDGITYSLLCRFLTCRERFRLRVVEGLKEDEGFKYATEYGQLWHEAEEAFAAGRSWKDALSAYYAKLHEKYPTNEKETAKWYRIAKLQFPLYIARWKNDVTQVGRKPVLEEEPFKIKYPLPSGRFVILRGKIDSIFSQHRRLKVQENKTKGEKTLDAEGIGRTAGQNLQTCIYHIAARAILKPEDAARLDGTLYNVILRPLSDKYAIRQRKGRVVKGKRVGAETDDQFYKRLAESIQKNQDRFFYRWQVPITDASLELFKQKVLTPQLEQLCDWWDSIRDNPFQPWTTIGPPTHGPSLGLTRGQVPNPHHWQAPWGVYNSMASGFRGDFFDLLTKGKQSNLITVDNIFPEL